jgi:hypothetical protein
MSDTQRHENRDGQSAAYTQIIAVNDHITRSNDSESFQMDKQREISIPTQPTLVLQASAKTRSIEKL